MHMKEIPLTRNMVAKVDDSDFNLLSQFKWHAHGKGPFYAGTNLRLPDGSTTIVLMHRLILDAPKDFDVDHANRDGLDNRRENLRPCTAPQNIANQERKINPDKTSKYKGVYRDWGKDYWVAQVRVNGKKIRRGFKLEIDAARAYDILAKKYFGEFARLNFVGA